VIIHANENEREKMWKSFKKKKKESKDNPRFFMIE
jgi:hypothetical protein